MSTPPNPPHRSRWRRRLYRLAAATLVPALVFGRVEPSLLRLRPNETFACVRLGDLEAREGNTDAAIAHYEAALQLQPDMPELAAHIRRLRER